MKIAHTTTSSLSYEAAIQQTFCCRPRRWGGRLLEFPHQTVMSWYPTQAVRNADHAVDRLLCSASGYSSTAASWHTGFPIHPMRFYGALIDGRTEQHISQLKRTLSRATFLVRQQYDSHLTSE